MRDVIRCGVWLFTAICMLCAAPLYADSYTLQRAMEVARVKNWSAAQLPVSTALGSLAQTIRTENELAISIVLWDPDNALRDSRVTAQLKDASAKHAIERLCQLAKLDYHVDDYAVILFPAGCKGAANRLQGVLAKRPEAASRIIIPIVECQDSAVPPAIAKLREEARRIDRTVRDYDIQLSKGDWNKAGRLNAWLYNAPVERAIAYLALAGGFECRFPSREWCVLSMSAL